MGLSPKDCSCEKENGHTDEGIYSTHACTHTLSFSLTHTCTHTHTHAFSLSLSLSHIHIHAHAHTRMHNADKQALGCTTGVIPSDGVEPSPPPPTHPPYSLDDSVLSNDELQAVVPGVHEG